MHSDTFDGASLWTQRDTSRLISQLAADVMAATGRDFDGAVMRALRRCGEYLQADRAYVFLLTHDGQLMNNTHEWCAPGISPQKDNLQAIPSDVTPWWWTQFKQHGRVLVPDVDQMPPEAAQEQQILQAQDIRSVCACPLRQGDRLIGFAGFDAVARRREWSSEVLEFLGLIGDLIAIGVGLDESRMAKDRALMRLENAERLAHMGHWELDLRTGELSWSAEIHRIFETDPGQLIPSYERFLSLIHPEDRERVSIAYQRSLALREPYQVVHRLLMPDGRIKHVEERCETEYGPDRQALVSRGSVQDITERVAYEQKLEQLAFHDALTGLPNRALIQQNLQQAMARTAQRERVLVFGVMDLDRFRTINEAHGQALGDRLLKAVAHRLSLLARNDQYLARLGGDEFAILVTGLTEPADGLAMAARLLAAIAEPITLDDRVFELTGSLGLTAYPQPRAVDAEQLLRQAQQALYQAKLQGGNHYHLYDAEQEAQALTLTENLAVLQRSIHEHGFELYYQPLVHMRSGDVVGLEALLRWHHPERGLLSPADFLPWVKDHPLDIELGEQVLATALEQMNAWAEQGIVLPVHVNISAQQIQHPLFVDRLRELVARFPRVSGQLALEILESSAMRDFERASQVMRACRSMGIDFALDDFGTGYSSLTYLRELPASSLKIDQSFVRGMMVNHQDHSIVNAVIGLGQAFAMRVVAEGVEDEATGCLLISRGCEYAQGYSIARPMPASDVAGWLNRWSPPGSWATAVPAPAPGPV